MPRKAIDSISKINLRISEPGPVCRIRSHNLANILELLPIRPLTCPTFLHALFGPIKDILRSIHDLCKPHSSNAKIC